MASAPLSAHQNTVVRRYLSAMDDAITSSAAPHVVARAAFLVQEHDVSTPGGLDKDELLPTAVAAYIQASSEAGPAFAAQHTDAILDFARHEAGCYDEARVIQGKMAAGVDSESAGAGRRKSDVGNGPLSKETEEMLYSKLMALHNASHSTGSATSGISNCAMEMIRGYATSNSFPSSHIPDVAAAAYSLAADYMHATGLRASSTFRRDRARAYIRRRSNSVRVSRYEDDIRAANGGGACEWTAYKNSGPSAGDPTTQSALQSAWQEALEHVRAKSGGKSLALRVGEKDYKRVRARQAAILKGQGYKVDRVSTAALRGKESLLPRRALKAFALEVDSDDEDALSYLDDYYALLSSDSDEDEDYAETGILGSSSDEEDGEKKKKKKKTVKVISVSPKALKKAKVLSPKALKSAKVIKVKRI